MRQVPGILAKIDTYHAAGYQIVLQLICLPPIFTKLGTVERFLTARARDEKTFLTPPAMQQEAITAMQDTTNQLVRYGKIAMIGLNRPIYGTSVIERRNKRALAHNLPSILKAIDSSTASITEAEREYAVTRLEYLSEIARQLSPAIGSIGTTAVKRVLIELQQVTVSGYRPYDVFGSTWDRAAYDDVTQSLQPTDAILHNLCTCDQSPLYSLM